MQEPFPRLDEPPPEDPKARWGIKEMVICTVVVLVTLFLIFSAIVEPVRATYGDDEPETLAASAVSNIVWNFVMIGAVIWFVRRGGGGLRDLGLTLPDSEHRLMRTVVFAAATFLAMYLIVILYGVAVDALGLEFLEPDQQVPDEFYDSDIALAILGVAIVLSAPLAEEVFFRGFLFGGTRPLTGVLVAAVITGFIFSLAHYNQGLVLPFTVVGALLALSYQRSGTLFVPIGAHFLFNLASYLVLVFVPEARPD
jgi:membrane protease YdiL (CAAX protease family)